MSDGPLSIVALLWCVAFGVTFGIGAALAIEIVKTAWQVVCHAIKGAW